MPKGKKIERPTSDRPLLVKVDEAARLLSLSTSKVYKMLEEGQLTGTTVDDRGPRLVLLSSVYEWVSQKTGLPVDKIVASR